MAQPSTMTEARREHEEFRKRQYADENGTYVLPNDAPEHDRLDEQSKALVAIMHNKPFHAPIPTSKGTRILDIGCGTGVMTHLLATAFPNAEVVGIDISPVPERHEKPANLTYVQGNVMELGGSKNELFADASFDYVFHRLLVLGMTDWPGYAAKVASLLKPGGWAEMQDYDMAIFDRSGACVSDDWWNWSCFREDAQAMGLDVQIGRKLGSLLRDSGLADVQEILYDVPSVYSDDLPEHLKPAGRSIGGMAQSPGYARALYSRVCGPKRSEEELERIVRDGNEKFNSVKPGDHARMGVAWGRKAD